MVVVARVEIPGAMAVPNLLGQRPQYRLNGAARVKARRADDRDSGVSATTKPLFKLRGDLGNTTGMGGDAPALTYRRRGPCLKR
jgi:hypothetical protein